MNAGLDVLIPSWSCLFLTVLTQSWSLVGDSFDDHVPHDEERVDGGNAVVEAEADAVEGTGEHDPDGVVWAEIGDADEFEDGEGSAAGQWEMVEDDGEEASPAWIS